MQRDFSLTLSILQLQYKSREEHVELTYITPNHSIVICNRIKMSSSENACLLGIKMFYFTLNMKTIAIGCSKVFQVNIAEFCVVSCGSGMTLPVAAQPLKWQTSHIPNDMRIPLVLGDAILSYTFGGLITWPKNKARLINTSRGFMLSMPHLLLPDV